MTSRVLLVDDDRSVRDFLQDALSRRGFVLKTSASGTEALALVATEDFDIVITDLRMPQTSGIDLCQKLAAERPDLPVVVITAFGSLETAVAAIRAGAYDFVTKPFDVGVLALTLERAARHRALREEVKRLRLAIGKPPAFDELLGSSAAMLSMKQVLDRVADSDSSVLITGESGTGKELVAQALHRGGRRREGPFVAVNCAALPEALLESELFGHARGAFTDARAFRSGLFVSASGGTLFLDEIGDLPLGLQPKLLRALQERRVRPVGSDSEVPFDTRIVAATNRDLEGLVEEHRFREDLYYRLNVIPLEIPPLRARGNDVLLLAQRFLEDVASKAGKPVRGVTTAAAEKLLAYAWPGNVRELQNCIERAVALTQFDQIGAEDLPDKVREYRPSRFVIGGEDADELIPLQEIERRYILRVLEAVGGNRTSAAKVLGLDRTTLWRKLERYAGGSSSPPGSPGENPPKR